jgi:hypothetical protein
MRRPVERQRIGIDHLEPAGIGGGDLVKRGQAAAKSLSAGGGGRADSTPSLDALADMYLSDPDAADKAFAKLKTQGLLG